MRVIPHESKGLFPIPVRPCSARAQDLQLEFLFGFVKDADSHVAPPPYPGTTSRASDETVICRVVWDYEFIASTLPAPERGVLRHGACVHFGQAGLGLCIQTDVRQA